MSNGTLHFPFRLEPAFYNRIWGYSSLKPWYDITADKEPIGEAWLTGEECKATTGIVKGLSLKEITLNQTNDLLGSHPESSFPLLLKLIFPKEKLSVQVHPDDELARKKGQSRGKTECWYALDAEPGTHVALGVKEGATRESIREAIQQVRLEELLNYVPVSKGDMVYVDAGTVHAIAPGAILLETQQTSDITYRMYDYGRPRPLHVEESLEALKLNTRAGKVPPVKLKDRTVLVDETYFRVERLDAQNTYSAAQIANGKDDCVQLLFVAAGTGQIEGEETIPLKKADLIVVPAAAKSWEIAHTDQLELIRIIPQYKANL